MLEMLHHVAYRCRDAVETVNFYADIIGLKFAAAIVQDIIPSSGAHQPNNHIFFQMEDGSHIAFFDILKDDSPTTPVEHDWAQHLALKVSSEEKAEEIAARLKAAGVDVLVHAHGDTVKSWYFYDPSGHRLEIAVEVEGSHRIWNSWAETAYDDLARWQSMKAAAKAAA